MKKTGRIMFLVIGVVLLTLSSCTSYDKIMREPNTKVDFIRSDFTLSNQFSAEAQSLRILNIDWSRLFTQTSGHIDRVGGVPIAYPTVPIVSSFMDYTATYALYDIMKKNPGYDFVFYPQWETTTFKPVLGIGFLAKITTVKATTRLGKFKSEPKQQN